MPQLRAHHTLVILHGKFNIILSPRYYASTVEVNLVDNIFRTSNEVRETEEGFGISKIGQWNWDTTPTSKQKQTFLKKKKSSAKNHIIRRRYYLNTIY